MTAETTFAPDDWRNSHRDFAGEAFRKNLTIVERLREYAEENGMTLPALAVAWTLSHPAVHVALVGARRASQLSDTLAAAEMHLTDTEKREVEAVFALAPGVVGPSPEEN